jgi:hypothetical protein
MAPTGLSPITCETSKARRAEWNARARRNDRRRIITAAPIRAGNRAYDDASFDRLARCVGEAVFKRVFPPAKAILVVLVRDGRWAANPTGLLLISLLFIVIFAGQSRRPDARDMSCQLESMMLVAACPEAERHLKLRREDHR